MPFWKKNNDTTAISAQDPASRHHNAASSEYLNAQNGVKDDSQGDKQQDQPTRLLPGGKMPASHGKAVVRRLGVLLAVLVIQVGIPLALYYGLRNVIGVVLALVISGIPPFLMVIYTFIKNRRLDALGVIIALSFILSGVVSIVSGDARAALVRDAAVGAIIGGFFLVTLIPINTKWLVLRPLIYIISAEMLGGIKYEWTDRDGVSQEQSMMEWQWEHIRFYRINARLQTAGWGLLLILKLVACVCMVELTDLSADDIVKYDNIATAVVVVLMVTASIIAGYYGGKVEKKIGQQWTQENDFTDKFEGQQQQQQQQQYPHHQEDGNDERHVNHMV